MEEIEGNFMEIKKETTASYVLSTILNERKRKGKSSRTLIIIHLHYIEDIEWYYEYMRSIPTDLCDIIVTCSDESVKDILVVKNQGFLPIRYVQTQNRGRDVSAFLVAANPMMQDYDYVCFLHDKKEKHEERHNDILEWRRSLWENTIGTRAYIYNIIDLFDKNGEVGLLVPPIYIGDRFSAGYLNAWANNYENTKQLCQMLGIQAKIDVDESPIALGTVFWARVSALKKLVQYEWKYEDFPEEPLADDGTISHAIERVLPYVVQDAGYTFGWVMTDKYAADYIQILRNALSKSFGILKEQYGLRYICELDSFNRTREQLIDFSKGYKHIYIYGAGTYGKDCLRLLKNSGIHIESFLISDNIEENEIDGVAVKSINEVNLGKNDGIIVAANKENCKAIVGNIKKLGIELQYTIYNKMKYE